MKKLIITSAILMAVVSSQAAVVIWNGTDDGNWATTANWDGGLVPVTPTDSHVLLQGARPSWPTVDSNVPNVGVLGLGWDAGGAHGILNIVDGGSLAAVHLRVGHNATGEINVSGGIFTAISVFELGVGEVSPGVPSVGTANLSGNGVIFSPSGHAHWNPGSVINISDDAIFLIGGDHTGADWIANNLIVAPEAGQFISASYDGGLNRTSFTAIPEPGTLGLFAGLGGALLFVRRKFRN